MTSRTASCNCGQLQARVTAEPIRVSVCHCLACQQRTGSVVDAQARFSSDFVTTSGRSKELVRLEGVDRAVVIPVGAFADPRFPRPASSVYEERMHSWVSMPPGIEHMA